MSDFHIHLLDEFKAYCLSDMRKDFMIFKPTERPVSVSLCYRWFCVSCNVDKQFARQLMKEWEREGFIEFKGNQKIVFTK